MVAPVVAAAATGARAAAATGTGAAASGAARAGATAARAPATTPRTSPRPEAPARGGEDRSGGQQATRRRPQPTYEEQEQQRRADKEAIRIDNLMAIAMLSIAFVMDAAQFVLSFLHVVPVVGNALALVVTGYIGVVASWMIFPLWFSLMRVEFLKGKQAGLKVAALGIPAVGEFVTFINALPLIIAGVAVNIAIARFEDVFGDFTEVAAELAKAKSPAERARMQVAMGQAFVSGRRYRPEEPAEAPQQKPAERTAAPGRAFDIANPAVYDYQNPEQEDDAEPQRAQGTLVPATTREPYPYRMNVQGTRGERVTERQQSNETTTPWDTRTRDEQELLRAAAVKRRRDAIEATS